MVTNAYHNTATHRVPARVVRPAECTAWRLLSSLMPFFVIYFFLLLLVQELRICSTRKIVHVLVQRFIGAGVES
jgi:hypothetical protein